MFLSQYLTVFPAILNLVSFHKLHNLNILLKSPLIFLRICTLEILCDRNRCLTEQSARSFDRLPEMFIAAVRKRLQIQQINLLRKIPPKILIQLPAGDSIIRSAPDIPAQHDFKHLMRPRIISRHGKGELIRRIPFTTSQSDQ